MAIKYTFKSEADIPAEQKPLYKQVGNEWILDIEGDPVAEYRNKNITLMRERDETHLPALRAYQDVGSAEDFLKLKSIKDQLDESKLIRSNKLDEALEKRTETMRTEHQKEVDKLQGKVTALEERLATEKIDKEAMEKATKLGARPTALTDIVSRIRSRFKLEDGKVVGYKSDGSGKDYGKSGDGITIEEVLQQMTADAPHLFEESKGTGADRTTTASSSTRGSTYTGVNPWQSDEKGKPGNLGLRMKIQREQPDVAKRLRREAGLPDVSPIGA